MVAVIGAGFGRTGTLSLKTALQRLLRGRCYHMGEVFKNEDHAEVWIRAARGEPTDLRPVLSDYVATVDWPACVFWRELMELYPQAKVLLSVRPAERWYESYYDTIHQTLVRRPAPGAAVEISDAIHELGEVVVKNRSFGPNYESLGRDGIIAAYERHNAEVRAGVPPGRLLEFDVAEGWEPLCAFLGVAVPDEEFPKRNDRDQFRQAFGIE